MTRIMATAVLAGVLLLSAADPARAQEGELVDRVAAVVEDRAVMRSDVEIELRRYVMESGKQRLDADEEKAARSEILESLIADLLMTVHAEKLGVEVAEDEVEQRLNETIDNFKRQIGGDEAFQSQLEREGMTLEQLSATYREKIRANLLIRRLLRQEVMSSVAVTEGEIRRYYREHANELPTRPATVTLSHIKIVPAISERAAERSRGTIDSIMARLDAGEEFEELARTCSDCPSAAYGGSLGYAKLADYNSPAFEEAVRALTVGEVSRPVFTRFGWHIIRLEDVRGEEVLLRHILSRVESGEADVGRAARLAEAVRDSLLAGADFAAMAARHSDDPDTREEGGFIGEVPMENLPEHIREIVAGVPDGGIAPLIKEQDGFRILKVLGRTPPRPFTFEESKDELRRVIENRKVQERLQGYVDDLKAIYYVDVKEGGAG